MKMKKQIRLSKSNDKRYRGYFKYLIVYNFDSGKSNRYDVLVLNADDPVTIGRELPLDAVRDLIKDYEIEAKKHSDYIGDHATVLEVKSIVKAYRMRNVTY